MIEQYYTKLHLLFITFNILQLHTILADTDLALMTQHKIKGFFSGMITLSLVVYLQLIH
jgi:hypothetical protein